MNCDTRHMLTEFEPKPDCVTAAVGNTSWDVVSIMTPDDIKGTRRENNPKLQAAWPGTRVDVGPPFYLDHLKRLRAPHQAVFRSRPYPSVGLDRGPNPRRRLDGPGQGGNFLLRIRDVLAETSMAG